MFPGRTKKSLIDNGCACTGCRRGLRSMDYNLGPTKNCLVGNWSEELSLKEYAGERARERSLEPAGSLARALALSLFGPALARDATD